MAELSTADPIATPEDGDILPVRKAGVAGLLKLTLLQTTAYIAGKLFPAMLGQAGKALIVNESETGFEYGVAIGGGGEGGGGNGSTVGVVPTVVQTANARRTATGNVTANLGAVPTPGNIMVAIISGALNTYPNTVPTGWVLVDREIGNQVPTHDSDNVAFQMIAVFMKIAGNAEPTAVTFNSADVANLTVLEMQDARSITFDLIPIPQAAGALTFTVPAIHGANKSAVRLLTIEHDGNGLVGFDANPAVATIYATSGAANHHAAVARVSSDYVGNVTGTFTQAAVYPVAVMITVGGTPGAGGSQATQIPDLLYAHV